MEPMGFWFYSDGVTYSSAVVIANSPVWV